MTAPSCGAGNLPSYLQLPTRPKTSRFTAVVFFLLFGCLAVASLYNLGPWTVPPVRIDLSPLLQTGTKEPAAPNNETVTETTTGTAMPPGKYSVG